MHKLDKSLAKLPKPLREKVLIALMAVYSREFDDLDLKKLKGLSDRYRVRVGPVRVIFEMTDRDIRVLEISKRSDNTYNF